MTASAPSNPAARRAASQATFFRQSGWMMLATITGGILMWAVHLLSKAVPAAEYGTLITLLSVVNLVPTMPLQMVFTQQTALAHATQREAHLAGLIRGTFFGIFLLWVVGALAVMNFRHAIGLDWHLANPLALPMLLLVILLSLCYPVLAGVMQGAQNFLWLGWCAILNGAGRIAAATLIVLAWHGFATGIMAGIAMGLLLCCATGGWQTQSQWRTAAESFDGRLIFRQMTPLMLGFAATQFLFSADTPFVNAYFGAERTAPYGAAGTLSRALLWLVLPLANVMFPKIVQSHARAEKSHLLGLTVLITGALAGVGFAGLWLTGPWLVPLIFPASYSHETLAVLPWYAGAMIPLVLANVLINDLLARSRFKIVPVLMILAAGYGFTLTQFHTSPTMVLQILGGFNLVLLAVCLAFAWWEKR
jgi:O-antigen/teichoic acid export membrane protein